MAKPIIIHYISEFDTGGAQSILLELYYAIDKYSEYKQIVYTRKIGSVRARQNAHSYGVELVELKDKKFAKHILTHKPCFLIYHKLFHSDTNIYQKLYSRIPIIVINHTFTMSKVWSKIKRCNYIVSVCKSMSNGIAKNRKLCKGNMATIFNGVNRERYLPIKARKRREIDNLITGRVNTFNKWKYSDGWIKWCSKVKLPKPMVHEYIGNGPFFKRARKYLSRIKNSRNHVALKGSITSFEEKISIMKSWDLFLYEINEQEGLSVSVLESLACGVPVICSNHFGNKEIIENGVNGYIFQNKNHAKDIMTELCESPVKLAKLKETTKIHFKEKHLDAKYMAKSYIQLLEKIKLKKR
jgi:glycosyltransferase involved in cell wall biosynthesis